jgi:hypothetical protein
MLPGVMPGNSHHHVGGNIRLDAQQRRRLCAEAACDERTLDRYLTGEIVRPSTAYRIERAAEAIGVRLVIPR